ncbi:nitrite reductase small subunit NirD [Corynebacterium tapiri]|uniref:Nitrite reductase small subunit NirD n=1 Tax=Corynebacterium tapiri TaxID=1448266 RepID=A0A5C4U611_9CORY|nr:nitrite reductase small subunit NirD [Corynebacterium tapiri]TNL98558.1 nitrite reductase small subunit NirD [Corynebacterium tapiri]
MSSTVVCRLDQLTPNLGAAALLENDRQIALFRLQSGESETVYAVDNVDPYTGVGVLSRGIVGEHDGRPVVASPLLKQKFYLDTGESLQGDEKSLATYTVGIDDGNVVISE